jgi:ribosomal peptide maturation radical SAM protein 1
MPDATEAAAVIEPADVSRQPNAGGQSPSTVPQQQTTQTPDSGDAGRNFRAALVTMPFAPFWTPSIQLGLLKSIARRAGFATDDYYPNLDLTSLLGIDFYLCVCLSRTTLQLTGDWLFSFAAFGEESNRVDYLAAMPEETARIVETTGKDVAFLNDLRERVIPEFVEDYLNRIDWGSYNIVGFTSTYQQHVASLALARRIKEKHPHVAIVFGGANMVGDPGMAYAKSFSYIDYVVPGEGDIVFPELLSRLAEGREADDMLGLITRCGDGVSFLGPAPLVQDLDSLPTPDYSSYFDTFKRLGIEKDPMFNPEASETPVEGSRGCWWGEKQHCVFCNHKDISMRFRSKSSDRVLREMDEIYATYGVRAFWATDDILDLKMIDGLFGRLAEEKREYRFRFFNLKSNMTREQIRVLSKGGVVGAQAGIESLNTHVLKLMRKGCTKLQNLAAMKWCRYYAILCGWNLLYGIPGEQAEDYVEQLETLRKITHFHPPLRHMQVVHLRYSPLYMDDELFPKKWRRPSAAYYCIYPERVDPDQIACQFDCEMLGVLPEEVHAETREFVHTWWGLWKDHEPALTYRRTDSDIVIDDTRLGPTTRSYSLFGQEADIYEAFDSAPRTPAQVVAALASRRPDLHLDEESVRAACDDFCEAGLMIAEAGKYLSLAIPAEPEL